MLGKNMAVILVAATIGFVSQGICSAAKLKFPHPLMEDTETMERRFVENIDGNTVSVKLIESWEGKDVYVEIEKKEGKDNVRYLYADIDADLELDYFVKFSNGKTMPFDIELMKQAQGDYIYYFGKFIRKFNLKNKNLYGREITL